MSRLYRALGDIHQLDNQAGKTTILTAVHPCVKLSVTLLYLLFLLSFPKYDLGGILPMGIYLILVYELGDISIKNTFSKLRMLFLLLLFLGGVNLFLDREVVALWGNVPLTGGFFSFLTLFVKGCFALLASYGLIASTGMENVCYGLQTLHVPQVFITVILLIYRYLILFLKEVERVSLAYAMRAPGQRGIHRKAWGSLVGAMLLRSVDRAERVYDGMQLRGFSGRIPSRIQGRVSKAVSIGYGLLMTGLIAALGYVRIAEIVGGHL